MLCYSHEYEGDTSIYEDEHVLDNIYKIKNSKILYRRIYVKSGKGFSCIGGN